MPGKTGKSGGTNAPPRNPDVGKGHAAGGGAKTGVGHGAPAGGGKKSPGAHAGEIYNPGVKNPTINPFLTAEDLMDYASSRSQYEQGINEFDFNYEQSVVNTQREKEAITKKEGFDLSSAKDDYGARGLQRSSVRDADLFDINATAEMKKTNLDANLNALKLHTDTEKARLQSYWENPETGYMHGLNLKSEENAKKAGGEMPEYSTEPSWSKKPGGSKPPPKPNSGGSGGVVRAGDVGTPHSPPTRSGGTQAPIHSPAVSSNRGVKGKLYG